MIPNSPVITTVIPTFRRPQLLRRAVLSVLRQTYENVLVCVYDNASDDETGEVVAALMSMDPRVRYHRHDENIGSYNNFNFGIKQVHTPFFSLLSDDDILSPKFYTRALQVFTQFPDVMLVCMPTMVIDEANTVLSEPMQIAELRRYSVGDGLKGMIEVSIPNTWTGIVFRKEVRDSIGLIDTSAGPFADAGFVWRAAARMPLAVSPELAAVLMTHAETTSVTVKPIDREWPGWWERMIQAVENDPLVPINIRTSIRAWVHPDFRKIGFYQVMRALAFDDHPRAAAAARGLGECGHPFTSLALRCLVEGCRYRMLPCRLLRFIRSSRQAVLTRTRAELTRKYQAELKFMDRLTEPVSPTNTGRDHGCVTCNSVRQNPEIR